MASISQQQFLRQIRGTELIRLFDLLTDVSFFIKDRAGRFMALNRQGCDYCGVKREHQAIGKTDGAFFPQQRTEAYAKDDEAVMATGRVIVNQVESAPEAEGSPHLVLTSKVPLRDSRGTIIGLAGFCRQLEQVRSRASGEARFAKVIEHLYQHAAETPKPGELARMAGLSQSQFARGFRRAFGTSARQYLLRVRVEASCRRLAETDLTVAAVAQEAGFFDHAHFTRCFRQTMGVTPSEYRRLHRTPAMPKRESVRGRSYGSEGVSARRRR